MDITGLFLKSHYYVFKNENVQRGTIHINDSDNTRALKLNVGDKVAIDTSEAKCIVATITVKNANHDPFIVMNPADYKMLGSSGNVRLSKVINHIGDTTK